MGRGLQKATKHALLQWIAPQYQNASPSQKKRVLEGFLAATGYVSIFHEIGTPTISAGMDHCFLN